jgi:hypothetical protein
MSPDRTVRLPVRVEADSTDILQRFAEDVRSALAESDIAQVHQVPQATRGYDLAAGLSLIVTAVEAAQSIARVVEVTRRIIDRYRQRGESVRLTMAKVDVTAGSADDVAERIAAGPEPSGDRHALIIANSHYDDERLAGLRGPVHDAEALTRVLGDPSIGGFMVEALLDGDERAIRRKISAFFAARARDDVCLLHFSCHGIKDEKSRLHFAACDTDMSMLDATGVPAVFVNDVIARTASRRVILILDCCYSGAFMAGATVRADDSVPVSNAFETGSGLIVLTASSATEYAFEGGELASSTARTSAFTGAIVQGLESGLADFDGNGDITVEELFEYVRLRVRETTPGQAPGKWVFGMEGNVIIARSTRPLPLPLAIRDELADDRVVVRMHGIEALAKLLTSPKEGLRTTALAELRRVADEDDSVRVRDLANEALGGGSVPRTQSRVDAVGSLAAVAKSDPPAPASKVSGRSRARLISAAVGAVVLVTALGVVVVTLTGSAPPKKLISAPLASKSAAAQFRAEALLGTRASGIAEVSFDADGLVVTASRDNTVELWDVTNPANPNPNPVFTFPHRIASVVTSAAFSPKGMTLAISTDSGIVKLYNIADPTKPALLSTLPGFGYQLAFNRAGSLLATTHQNSLRLWDVTVPTRPKLLYDFGAVHKLNIQDIAFSPDGQLLATASGDGTARIWTVINPLHPVAQTTLSDDTASIEAITFRPQGRMLATASLDGTVKLWDVTNPALPTVAGAIPSPAAEEVAFSPDGQTLLVVSKSKDVPPELWSVVDVKSPHLLATLDDLGGSWDVAFSPNGQTVAIGDTAVASLWNVSP